MPAVTLETLSGYLDRFGWHKYLAQEQPGQSEGYLVAGWKADDENSYTMIIDPVMELGVITFRSSLPFKPNLATLPEERTADFLRYLLYRSYKILFGKWTFDPRDGEIVFHLTYGIDDGFPFERFQRLMLIAIREVAEQAPLLSGLLDGSRHLADLLADNPGSAVPASAAPRIN